MPMPESDEKVMGGHAVLCIGYDDDEQMFIVRNSWGESWGLGGYFKMPYAFLTDPDLASDFWIVETISRVPAAVGELAYTSMFPKLDAVPENTEAPTGEEASTQDDDTLSTQEEAETDSTMEASALHLTGTWADGGRSHRAGCAAKVTWETNGSVQRVKLQYCVNSWSGMLSSWSTIVESVANHGNYRWRIPADAAPDTRYWLRVLSVEDSSVYSDSAYFEVEAPEYCSISSA